MGTGTQRDHEPDQELPPFEPGLPPANVQNRRAAAARGLTHDTRRKVYLDKEGWPVRDRYGHLLG